ncbi:hypothetical protein B0H15DRAFT_943824 [Mycena belliarum]|uniref:Secreted protein n=1 Tax=Mycena belliarum TaxID=1033014 RepID=A0AAD6UIQ9_9AGAR|nr:hypothetical protein B0H15DRAFT_943824 [Mycena belliae]
MRTVLVFATALAAAAAAVPLRAPQAAAPSPEDAFGIAVVSPAQGDAPPWRRDECAEDAPAWRRGMTGREDAARRECTDDAPAWRRAEQ